MRSFERDLQQTRRKARSKRRFAVKKNLIFTANDIIMSLAKKERIGPAFLIKDVSKNSPVCLQRIIFAPFDDKDSSSSLKTKRDALIKETAELFKVRTLHDLVIGANQAKNHLEHVGIFSSVGVIIDFNRKGSQTDDGSNYELKFLVKEPRYPKGRVGVDVSTNGEAVSTLRAHYSNALGRGESFSAQKLFGYNHSSLFNLSFAKPFLGWQRYSGLNLQAYRSYEEASWGKYSNLETGVVAGLHYKPQRSLSHQIRWVGAWRNLSCLTNDASFDIRTHSGHSLKSSIQSDLEFSTLNCPFVPEKGLSLRLLQEFAGLGGDVTFLQNNLEFKSSTKLFLGLVLSTGLHASYTHAMSGPTLPVVDRTFLGGPSNLRGFKLNSVGPQSDGCFLGGMGSWCVGVHLYRALYPAHLIFAHLFSVAGNVHGVESGCNLDDVIRRLTTNPRVSVGAGLAVRLFGICQLEFNYCIPVRSRSTDSLQQGFQFGAGINFV